MSLEIIDEFDVFNHRTISPADIQYLYKPYGEICPSDPENKIIQAIEKNSKIIIRGWSGTGKTCLINYVVSKLDIPHFPIMFPVWIGSELDQICSDASEFVAFMLHTFLSTVQDAKKISAKEHKKYRKYLSGELSYKEGKKDSILAKLSAKFSWIPGFASTSAEVGGEIEKYVEYALKERIYLQDRVGCVNEIIKILNSQNITPVFVFDDTDKFLRRGIIDKTDLIDKFFVYVVPLFDKFACPLILPVHENYSTNEAYKDAEKRVMDVVVTIPDLSLDGFSKMLEHKVKSVLKESQLNDFIEAKAIALVYSQLYERRTDERMRNSLLAIKEAIKDAVNIDAIKVDVDTMAHHLLD